MTYKEKKEKIVEEAMIWQSEFPDRVYDWDDLIFYHDYFTRNARRYGLIREFTENGII